MYKLPTHVQKVSIYYHKPSKNIHPIKRNGEVAHPVEKEKR
jgi:hypothetical protein